MNELQRLQEFSRNRRHLWGNVAMLVGSSMVIALQMMQDASLDRWVIALQGMVIGMAVAQISTWRSVRKAFAEDVRA